MELYLLSIREHMLRTACSRRKKIKNNTLHSTEFVQLRYRSLHDNYLSVGKKMRITRTVSSAERFTQMVRPFER